MYSFRTTKWYTATGKSIGINLFFVQWLLRNVRNLRCRGTSWKQKSKAATLRHSKRTSPSRSGKVEQPDGVLRLHWLSSDICSTRNSRSRNRGDGVVQVAGYPLTLFFISLLFWFVEIQYYFHAIQRTNKNNHPNPKSAFWTECRLTRGPRDQIATRSFWNSVQLFSVVRNWLAWKT